MLKVLQVLKVLQDQVVGQVLKVLQVLRVLLDQVVEQDQQVLKVQRVVVDLQVLLVLKVHLDQLFMRFLQVGLSYGLVQQMLFHLVGYYVMGQTQPQTLEVDLLLVIVILMAIMM